MPIPIGTLTINIPDYIVPPSGSTINQGYEFDFEYTSYTGNTNISYIGIGTSRLSELKKYGSNQYIQDLEFGTTNDGVSYTGYTFTYTGQNTNAILHYRDRADGYTEIAGSTSGFTKEEVFQQTLTRNEHFLGFVEEPRIYSDLFVDRGKQGVVEKNLRLGEIDNLGELSVYGNGYFKIRKQ
mgnify:FL=1